MWVGGFHKFQSFALQNNVFFSFLFFGGGLPLEENSKTINIWSLSSFVFFTALSKILVIVTIICCFHLLSLKKQTRMQNVMQQRHRVFLSWFLLFCSSAHMKSCFAKEDHILQGLLNYVSITRLTKTHQTHKCQKTPRATRATMRCNLPCEAILKHF